MPLESISTRAYRTEIQNDDQALLDRREQILRIELPSGYVKEILIEMLPQACLEVISNPHPQWPLIFGPNATWEAREVFSTENDLQLTSSLFQLTHELIYRRLVDNFELEDLNTLKGLFGRGFASRDRLGPANALIVPSEEFQRRVRNEDREQILYKSGLLFLFHLKEGSREEEFYFRPYHTPIMRRLHPIEPLYEALRAHYRELLGED